MIASPMRRRPADRAPPPRPPRPPRRKQTRRYHLGLDQNEGGTRTYTTKVQLPAGLTCDGVTARCVVQFHYMTGNSCAAPDEPAKYLGTANLQTCGAPGAPYPVRGTAGEQRAKTNGNPSHPTYQPTTEQEEFWNLGDVKIVGAGSVPPAASPPPAACLSTLASRHASVSCAVSAATLVPSIRQRRNWYRPRW